MGASSPLPQTLSARFLVEARGVADVPPLGPPEIAVAGRSNVGKSTLINCLAGRHALARVSKTPGRTRGLIFYELSVRADGAEPRTLRLVDLPGYGYAKVSAAERQSWKTLVEGYVEKRPTLKQALVLVDARRGFDADERELIVWLATLGVPFPVVATKIDKLSASERGKVRDRLRADLAATPAAGAAVLPVSGETGDGVDRLWRTMLHALA